MKSPAAIEFERQRADAVAIGETLRTADYVTLIKYLSSSSPMVRRAAASAAGKLMGFDSSLARSFAFPLLEAIRKETADQVCQYELKALLHCAAEIPEGSCGILEDIARNATVKPYVRDAANEALAAVQKATAERESLLQHWCTRCKRVITKEESAAGIAAYGKPYCRHCLDERQLEDKRFERDVEAAKRLRTTDGTAVQSQGERRIADYLSARKIEYVYDERYRIADDVAIRPDFYLPEFDLYIEYWGMDTHDYQAHRQEKLFLYQRAGKKLISLDYRDLPHLENILGEKLSRYIRWTPGGGAEGSPSPIGKQKNGKT